MKYVLLIFLVFSDGFTQTLWNGQGHIPQSSQVDWTNAGLLPNTPTVASNLVDVTDPEYGAIPNDGQNDFEAIHDAILAARSNPGLTIIYFPPGTYNINSRIDLTYLDNDIVFQGAGSNQTVLKFTVGHTTQCFYIHGYQTSTAVYLSASVSKGSRDLYGNNISSLRAGEWIRLSEYNHGIFSSWAYGSIGQITQLASIQGNHAIMKDEASKYYSYANGTCFWKIVPVRNVGIEKLKIYRNDTGHDNEGTNVLFEYAVNCWAKGVESEYTSRHHVDIWYSSHIYVSGCYFHKSRNYGGDGRAYGVVLNFSTTNCLVENNIFRYLRHSMLVQAGANCNVFTYNYSRETHWENVPPTFKWLVGENIGKASDITLHGNYSYANLFEQNCIELVAADDSHGVQGPYNAFVRNVVFSDPDNKWYVISLFEAPHSSILGNLIWWADNCPLQTFGSTTSVDVDLYGRAIYQTPPNNTYETGTPVPHYLEWFSSIYSWDNCQLNDISYYYSSKPNFVSSNYTWPSCGPGTYPELIFPSQSVPARGRWFNSSIRTYISDPIQWPAQPLTLNIMGQTHLNSGQTGEYSANASGGSGTYTNYKWWYRNDEGIIDPYSLAGGIVPNAPQPGEWVYMSWKEGQQTISMGSTFDFSIKCEVTDSDNNAATDIHSVTVGEPSPDVSQQSQKATLTLVPNELSLDENYPNPFNSTTMIRFGLSEAQHVSMKIYSVTGELVKTLVDNQLSEGYHQVVWNGRNQSGSKVASGIYIYEMRTKERCFIKKMLLAK